MKDIIEYLESLPVGNQWKHFVISVTLFHFAGWIHWALELSPKNSLNMWWFMIFAWILLTVNFEVNQARLAIKNSKNEYQFKNLNKVMTSKEYWSVKWLDSLLDVLAGVIGCILGILPFWLM